jgi:hypothetical protein
MKPLVKRSSRWPAVRRAHLATSGTCAGCGRADEVEVHHKVPVHVDPALELEPTNLITLCEGPTMNCHLWIGHLGHWRSWNKTVARDALRILGRVLTRPMK